MRAVLERYRVFWWLRRRATRLVMLILVVAVLFSAPVSERYGDRLQIALPVAGLVCTVLTGGAGEYLIRFAVLEVLLHGSKQGLGAAAINRRPDGGLEGFPSGHTAAAAFGASVLVHDCIRASAPARAVVLIAAGFTGASRIAAGKHTIWQVLGGVLLGWGTERLFRRRPRRFLRWIKDMRRGDGQSGA